MREITAILYTVLIAFATCVIYAVTDGAGAYNPGEPPLWLIAPFMIAQCIWVCKYLDVV